MEPEKGIEKLGQVVLGSSVGRGIQIFPKNYRTIFWTRLDTWGELGLAVICPKQLSHPLADL